jgi:copper chaperone
MELITFKTNINSESALNRVAPFLNQVVGASNWQLDLNSREKKLTVFSNSVINEIRVEEAIKRAGFRAMNLDDYFAIY